MIILFMFQIKMGRKRFLLYSSTLPYWREENTFLVPRNFVTVRTDLLNNKAKTYPKPNGNSIRCNWLLYLKKKSYLNDFSRILIKPDYSEVDFCIATTVLHAKESQHLRMMENDQVEKMDMEKDHISAL